MSKDLIEQIGALLALDKSGALVPHGIGGHARELLTRCAAALSPPAVEPSEESPLGQRIEEIEKRLKETNNG